MIRPRLRHIAQGINAAVASLTHFNIEVRREERDGDVSLWAEEDNVIPEWGSAGYFYVRYRDNNPEVSYTATGIRYVAGQSDVQVASARMRLVAFAQEKDADELESEVTAALIAFDGVTMQGFTTNRARVYTQEVGGEYQGNAPTTALVAIDFTLEVRVIPGCDPEDIDYCPDDCPEAEPASITTNNDSPALEVASGASQDIAVHDTAGADVGSRSGATVTIGDTTVTVNGSAYDTTEAESTLDVPVLDDKGNPVGTPNPGVSVVVADANVTVNGVLSQTVQPEGTTTINVTNSDPSPVGTVAPLSGNVSVADSPISINSTAFADVPAEDSLNIEVVDGADAATGSPSGGKWVVPDEYFVAITADESETTLEFTVYFKDGGTRTVSQETLTNGTIDSGGVVVNSDPGVNTFVGVELSDGDVITLTYTASGGDFLVELEF